MGAQLKIKEIPLKGKKPGPLFSLFHHFVLLSDLRRLNLPEFQRVAEKAWKILKGRKRIGNLLRELDQILAQGREKFLKEREKSKSQQQPNHFLILCQEMGVNDAGGHHKSGNAICPKYFAVLSLTSIVQALSRYQLSPHPMRREPLAHGKCLDAEQRLFIQQVANTAREAIDFAEELISEEETGFRDTDVGRNAISLQNKENATKRYAESNEIKRRFVDQYLNSEQKSSVRGAARKHYDNHLTDEERDALNYKDKEDKDFSEEDMRERGIRTLYDAVYDNPVYQEKRRPTS